MSPSAFSDDPLSHYAAVSTTDPSLCLLCRRPADASHGLAPNPACYTCGRANATQWSHDMPRCDGCAAAIRALASCDGVLTRTSGRR